MENGLKFLAVFHLCDKVGADQKVERRLVSPIFFLLLL